MERAWTQITKSVLNILIKVRTTGTHHQSNWALKMEEIEHKYVQVNGLKLHVAEIGKIGSSPAVVFLHGFPEIWYSWRHQMTAVARAGYRAIAPDYRGYGLSDPPPEPEKTTFMDLLADILALLDVLGLSKLLGDSCAIQETSTDFKMISVLSYVRPMSGIIFSAKSNENQEIMDILDVSTPLPLGLLRKIFQSLHEEFNIANLKVEVRHWLSWARKGLLIKIPWY
ncbi:hypothetical protein BUALT_BualtUnG0056100 [Buddleja alternifolia]|uniref:AB hydrolase-1 domain-containing protein n=1 Tax=Buddleja alternifolia TaxID=168488 RepID=A0AAV6VYU9_9LAMI|nr:hypothetical protein BUALT_BualtUnG0056100 [Buddleja alternifolia]